MKVLDNFLLSWLLMFLIVIASTARLFIAPLFFIFSRDEYKKSTEDKVNNVHTSLMKFAIGCCGYFRKYWRE